MYNVNIHIDVSFNPDTKQDLPALEHMKQEIARSVLEIRNKYAYTPEKSPSSSEKKCMDFFQFARQEIVHLKIRARFSTARNYQTVLSRLQKFTCKSRLDFSELDQQLLTDFETALRQDGCHLNTISCYMRTLRAIYNKAVKQNLTLLQPLFKSVFTGNERTRKRAIPHECLQRLLQLDCSDNPALQLAKDLFLFSLYARGISFVDMAYLKHSHIRQDYLIYYRRKTHQQLAIRIEPPLREILNRYQQDGKSPYIFPLLTQTSPRESYLEYRYQLTLYNKRLYQLEQLLGTKYHLSSYVSRHTWATMAKDMAIPLSVISESLGHTSEKTTYIYMKSLEKQRLDEANQKLIRRIAYTQHKKRGKNGHGPKRTACSKPASRPGKLS